MMQLSEAVAGFHAHCQYSKNLSPLTRRAYKTDLAQFLSKVQPSTQLHAVTKNDIRVYVKSLFELNLKETSIRRKIATLKALFNFLEFDERIASNPMRQLGVQIRMPRRIPRSISLQFIRKLLTRTRSDTRRVMRRAGNDPFDIPRQGVFVAVQRLTILELLFATGMRVGELSQLNVEDVDLSKQTVRVFGKGSRERTIALTHKIVIDTLKAFFALRSSERSSTDPLLVNRLGKRMQPHSIRTLVANSASASGLPTRVTPHVLRHTIATLMLENGIDIRFVQRLLGHSSILTTQWYTHTSSKAERKMLQTYHPRNLF